MNGVSLRRYISRKSSPLSTEDVNATLSLRSTGSSSRSHVTTTSPPVTWLPYRANTDPVDKGQWMVSESSWLQLPGLVAVSTVLKNFIIYHMFNFVFLFTFSSFSYISILYAYRWLQVDFLYKCVQKGMQPNLSVNKQMWCQGLFIHSSPPWQTLKYTNKYINTEK